MSERTWVSVKTAAYMVDLSEATIRTAINNERLPAHKVGRSPRIKVADLDEWIESLPKVGGDDA